MAAYEVHKEQFWPRPAPQPHNAYAHYTRPTGGDMLCRLSRWARSDIIDRYYVAYSQDHGRTWSEPQPEVCRRQTPDGTWRRRVYAGITDPATGQLISMRREEVLPSDQPLEGMQHRRLKYAISDDGGHTAAVEKPVIHEGDEYDEGHPLPGVWIGRNAAMIDEITMVPIWRADGTLLVAMCVSPLDEEGRLYNPFGAYTYTVSAVLLGKRRGPHEFAWELSELVAGDPAQSTRGWDEPTIAQMPDGRLLMICRGSNDQAPSVPGYKWMAVSTDGGYTWTTPEPWRYDGGDPFFSPSACSQLVQHSSGRYFWIGNITPHNPRGNRPRYPLVIGEVDSRSLLLKRETVTVIDTRQADDDEMMTLSNFHAHEDRETREVVVYCARLHGHGLRSGAAHRYRIAV